MKIIAVIPARYQSSRFPGKPLADICGKPMIWWVYQQVIKANNIEQVVVAIDDARIEEVCQKYNIEYLMTNSNHPDHICRVKEVSDKVEADYYICVNGDEPLIDASLINSIVPKEKIEYPYFSGAMRVLNDPVQTIDPANIKVVTNKQGKCLYLSRSPIPYPKGSLEYSYQKYIGIECFNKTALDFFASTPMGVIERIEDIDHIRFLENGITMQFNLVDSDSLSVDTEKDLEFVRNVIHKKLFKGNL